MHRFLVTVLFATAAQCALAQDVGTKVSALALGDYYWVAQHHDDELENRNGFWFRRIFLTVDQTVSRTVSARLRLEANQPGDFKSAATLQPYVKDAWLKWRRSDSLNLVIGLSPDPMAQSAEDFWGYRALEKTPLDLYRIVNTRDIGIAALGRIHPKMRYHVMVGNGAGIGGEIDSGKQLSLLFGFDPNAAFTVEISGERNELENENRTTAQALAGYRWRSNRVGVLYVHHTRGDFELDMASAFAVYAIRPKVTAVVRVDRLFDPNPDGAAIPYLPLDPEAKSTLLIAGTDFKLDRHFGLIPNVEWVMNDGSGDDIIPRITFYFTF